MKTGVYSLLLEGKVVYVGATTQWPVRITAHKTIDFDEARLIECKQEDLLHLENKLIGLLKPKHNVKGTTRTVHKRLTDAWVIDNHALIKSAAESGRYAQLRAKAINDLGFSPRYGVTDMVHVMVMDYERIFETNFDWDKKIFS